MTNATDPLGEYLSGVTDGAVAGSVGRTNAIDRVLGADLWVIGEQPSDSADGGDDDAVQIAQLRQEDVTIVPAFTSAEKLRSFSGDESPALELAASVLFESCGAEATFVVNPGTVGSLTVTAGELRERTRPLVTSNDTPSGASAKLPKGVSSVPSGDRDKEGDVTARSAGPATSDRAEVADPVQVDAEDAGGSSSKANIAMLLLVLRDALDDCPTVKAGFAGNFVAEGRERTVVGLDLDPESDPDPVVRRISDALEDVGPSDAAVDLILLDRSPGPLTDALRNGEPFYRRRDVGSPG